MYRLRFIEIISLSGKHKDKYTQNKHEPLARQWDKLSKTTLKRENLDRK